MTLALPETPGGTLAKKANTLILEHVESCDVAIIGPGLSGNAETTQLIWELIFNISKPVVLDTDAINALIIGVSVMRKRESLDFLIDYFAGRPNELILTLDVGDLFKLISAVNIDKKFTIKYVQEHPQEVLEIVTRALSCTTVLNVREPMIITCTGITIITPSTASDEPTGASGDALSGIIGSFVAQNPGKHLEAIATAVYLYVKTKEFALEKKDKEVILPSDIVRYLPGIIKDIENE
jgi:NAD(P)H-hydrate epimerase